MSTFSMLTYNLHKGFSIGNFKFVLPHVKKALHQVDADIICLQEVVGVHLQHRKNIKEWPRQQQHRYLGDDKWPFTVYGKNAQYRHGHHGNAIISKLKILSWENMDVSNQRFSRRSVLHAVIYLPDATKPLHIMCIHFGLLKNERRKQLQMLCERIRTEVPEDEPLIVAGDFNDWLKHANDELQSVLHLKEVFKEKNGNYARSFPVWKPMLTVDRIYYRGLECLDCECLTGSPWAKLSDHAPLFARFSFK